MIQELNTYECAKALIHDDNASWSRGGAFALIEYLEQVEQDCGISINFDPIALRCEYSEYESYQDFANQFWHIDWQRLKNDNVIKEYIEYNTVLIEFDGGIIVQDF